MRKYTIQGMRVNLAEEEENQESESEQANNDKATKQGASKMNYGDNTYPLYAGLRTKA